MVIIIESLNITIGHSHYHHFFPFFSSNFLFVCLHWWWLKQPTINENKQQPKRKKMVSFFLWLFSFHLFIYLFLTLFLDTNAHYRYTSSTTLEDFLPPSPSRRNEKRKKNWTFLFFFTVFFGKFLFFHFKSAFNRLMKWMQWNEMKPKNIAPEENFLFS